MLIAPNIFVIPRVDLLKEVMHVYWVSTSLIKLRNGEDVVCAILMFHLPQTKKKDKKDNIIAESVRFIRVQEHISRSTTLEVPFDH